MPHLKPRVFVVLAAAALGSALPAAPWTYIQIDGSRQKWGDWDQPGWLRYFGLDAGDVNHDGALDIVSGRYVYLNPGGDMSAPWPRVDLGRNTDGALFLDVDGDEHADLIATSLPVVYWAEALNREGTAWSLREVARITPTSHVNGQGFLTADVIPGGRKEILLSGGDGLYLIEVPADPTAPWPTTRILPGASDEGFAVGDLDGDGDLDIAASAYLQGEPTGQPRRLFWWRNPGKIDGPGETYFVHESRHDIDRIRIADLNADGRPDLIYTEERYPGAEPDARLVWLEAPADPARHPWREHVVITQYSMNNLDVGDVDGDGAPDLVTNEHKGTIHHTQVFLNDGHGRFTKELVDTGREMHLGARLADLDGDGDLDLFGHAWDDHRFLHLWRNDRLESVRK